MKTIGEALAEVMSLGIPLRPSGIPLLPSFGLLSKVEGAFLARPLDAWVAIPSFPASTVDGYAVRASEVFAGARLRVASESRAGGPTPIVTAPGTTTRVFTGAPVPTGADAVVMQEVVRREGADAIFEAVIRVGAGVRALGSDIAVGERLLEAGTRVDAGVIALHESQGAATACVRLPVRVGLVTTGDEVVTHAARSAAARPRSTGRHRLVYGTIYDVNGPMLGSLCRAAGATLSRVTHARDAIEETREAIETAILASDVVVIAGGVSVGEHDVVHAALAALGVEQRLWKVRMKPGKPFTLGVKGRVPIFGLPGNPVSAWVGFEVFVRPMLRRMLGDPRPFRRVIDVTLGASVRCSADRTELARARLDDEGVAWPFAKQGSAALTSMVAVDALLILPEREGELAAGDRVRAMLLDGRGSATPPF